MHLIGPNGAGKTTVFNCLTGFYKPSGGSILLDGQPIQGLAGHEIARKGVVRTFQNVRLFKDMTAGGEPVDRPAPSPEHQLPVPACSRPRRSARASARRWSTPEYWLDKVNLTEFANRPAGTLAYGQQRRLEIARCMMTRPRSSMLDEPAAGLNPKETEDLKALIRVLREEHNVTRAADRARHEAGDEHSDHIVVINQGTPLADGTPEQIRDNPDVIKAYLGGERNMLQFENVSTFYGKIQALHERQRGGAPGRDRHPDRRQRRRQVHPADDPVR